LVVPLGYDELKHDGEEDAARASRSAQRLAAEVHHASRLHFRQTLVGRSDARAQVAPPHVTPLQRDLVEIARARAASHPHCSLAREQKRPRRVEPGRSKQLAARVGVSERQK